MVGNLKWKFSNSSSLPVPVLLALNKNPYFRNLFFYFFTADIPQAAPNRSPIKILQYADDFILYISAKGIVCE